MKMLGFVAILFLLSSLLGLFFNNMDLSNKIVVIEVKGPIGIENNLFVKSSEENIIDDLDEAAKDDSVKGIILEIDSNGGTPVASKEVADKIKSIGKPVVALVKGAALSGAYWVASSSDKIVADELSLLGSVGVRGSFLQFSGFLKDHDIEYERLVAGKYKDAASPFKGLTDDEKDMLQKKLDLIHDYFIEDVKANRKLSDDEVKRIRTAELFLGKEAKELNLVDEFGNIDVAKNITLQLANITDAKLVKKKDKISFLEYLGKYSLEASYSLGKGIGSSLIQSDIKIES
ncbi:signal peptide peptidase SppA [Candidatus Woesearchaeota archaeon]|nr:MAG: signal peptide peptidase SppA [Candidatus Woesearchaeota archaeon]